MGVEPGDRVGLWLDKSVLMVAAMQACLRLGAAYVPLDPLSPAPRVATICADANLKLLVCTPARVLILESATQADTTEKRERLVLALEPGEDAWRAVLGEREDALADRCSDSPSDSVEHRGHPDALAYILYTSGSTGVPKGVCISHRNARAFIDWAVAALELQTGDRLSSHAPFHFDLSVLDLYGALSVGAELCLLSHAAAHSPTRLVDYGAREQISVWYSVPSALILMMQRGGLRAQPQWRPRVVCFAGEPFPIAQLRALREHWPHARLFNLYGPTETNVCAAYEVGATIPSDRTLPLPIGVACSGARLWVETEPGVPAPAGEPGELIVEGPTVMLGYWGRPPQCGPYRSGDLVRRDADGQLEFLGRRDHMVKVRGHRIELGEIEATLGTHPALAEVAVIVDGEGLDAKLVAFFTTCGEPGMAGDKPPSLLALKRLCATRLPPYMVIDRARVLEAIDRTRNGKVDRRALAGRLRDS